MCENQKTFHRLLHHTLFQYSCLQVVEVSAASTMAKDNVYVGERTFNSTVSIPISKDSSFQLFDSFLENCN